jgi:hypothetical protein
MLEAIARTRTVEELARKRRDVTYVRVARETRSLIIELGDGTIGESVMLRALRVLTSPRCD